MKRSFFLFLSLVLFAVLSAQTTQVKYDLLIKGGKLIDPKNNINAETDVAIKDGKIASVGKDIPAREAKQVINAKGLLVTPGLIDIHGHVFHGTQPDHYLSDGFSALPPDGFTFRAGVTTIVDCGSAGWKNFSTFKKNVIEYRRRRNAWREL
jgi:dihydroorotase